ncbi:hypothetical protein ACHAWF_010439 [Thalassiosira exigua]
MAAIAEGAAIWHDKNPFFGDFCLFRPPPGISICRTNSAHPPQRRACHFFLPSRKTTCERYEALPRRRVDPRLRRDAGGPISPRQQQNKIFQ